MVIDNIHFGWVQSFPCAILGMVPMAVGTGEGAEMWRPMGTAVIGGLTFSTILTLLFVPVLYCVFAGNGIKRQRRAHHKNSSKQ